MRLLLLPGDGIGPEISAVARKVVEAIDRRFALGIEIEERAIGFAALEAQGTTLPASVLAACEEVDGVILGPVDSAAYPRPEDGGVNPSAAFRKIYDLYANIRPAKARSGIGALAPDMDLILVRENTEGFYADRTMFAGNGEFMPTPDLALAVRKITRDGSYRIGHVAAEIAASRPRRKLTIVTKSNVLTLSDGLFRDCCMEAAREYPELVVEEVHVDAMASLLVRTPAAFDVVVTSNMFGDILSNLANELAGGLGLGASINAGDGRAIAQASHGSAPDIAGMDTANPAALVASSGMLLDWLGEQSDSNVLREAARVIDGALDAALADPANRTVDLGGALGTQAFGEVLVRAIDGG
ncbi:MAG: isocitrate/isopropylmalate family dehydrogenase [Proteobacteria bacterium]|nr:isocitrate/isopropylmalate family dehydrogenase [Pseudomonadota bacterium]